MSREGIGCKSRSVPQAVPTTFIWPHGGRQVHLCGSFTSWQNTLPMSPLDNCPSIFQVTCNLPPGYYQYKFFVDGEWRYDHQGSISRDAGGNVNNCVQVKMAELAAASPPNGDGAASGSSMDVDQNSHLIDLQETQSRPQQICCSEVEASKQRVAEFLVQHTAYELLPESGKVIALDVTLPVKEAFHILHEQALTVAPLWDSERQQFVGMLTASDFIIILKQLGNLGVLSEQELDTHTISIWKEEKSTISRTPRHRRLVSVGPDDSLRVVADKLLVHEVSTVPVLACAAQDGFVPQALHLATLSDVLKCILRHFRHLPSFLQQPIYTLPIGTWSPALGGPNARPLAMLRQNAPLSDAFALLLQAGVSALPVVDENGSLVDVYTRSDITALARDRAYATVHLHEITVSQALQMGQDSRNGGPIVGPRCHMCLRSNTLRDIIERLASPGVRRVICVEAGSRHVEGIISLRDVLRFLMA